MLSVIRSLPPALAETVIFMLELPRHLISVSVVAVNWASTDSSKADSHECSSSSEMRVRAYILEMADKPLGMSKRVLLAPVCKETFSTGLYALP